MKQYKMGDNDLFEFGAPYLFDIKPVTSHKMVLYPTFMVAYH